MRIHFSLAVVVVVVLQGDFVCGCRAAFRPLDKRSESSGRKRDKMLRVCTALSRIYVCMWGVRKEGGKEKGGKMCPGVVAAAGRTFVRARVAAREEGYKRIKREGWGDGNALLARMFSTHVCMRVCIGDRDVEFRVGWMG